MGRLLSRVRGHGLLATLIATALVVGVLVADSLSPRGQAATSALGAPEQALQASEGVWLSAWTAAPTGAHPDHPDGMPGQAVRNVLRPTGGGTAVRVTLSNRYGATPLRLSHVTVALAAAGGPAAVPETMRRLSFDGAGEVSIPAGGETVSDAARLEVPVGSDLLVTVYAPGPGGAVTHHRQARQTSYVADGDHTAEASGDAFSRKITDWRYVTGVQLLSQNAEGAVAVLGDSLTDGVTSTAGANRRWTDRLAERMRESEDGPRYTVLNLGISGNRLLSDAAPDRPFNADAGVRRLHTDVLPRSELRAVVVQLGINDIIRDPDGGDAEALLAGLRQVAADSREAGLVVAGATLAPFAGHGGWRADREEVRERVNAAIRAGGVFDTVIDLDEALRDPAQPDRLLPAYNSGDHLHPSDAGYAAMAAAVRLAELAPTAEIRT
nr:GDSL-type esterase/lipase family protein [Streptomyces lonarensis]